MADAPEQIQQIRNEKNRRYAQARKLHESIRMMDSREHRLQAGLELLDHMHVVNDARSAIDEWSRSGQIRHQEQMRQAVQADQLTRRSFCARNKPRYQVTKDMDIADYKS